MKTKRLFNCVAADVRRRIPLEITTVDPPRYLGGYSSTGFTTLPKTSVRR